MSATPDVVLVLNRGSSSLKYAAFAPLPGDLRSIVSGQVDPAGTEEAFDVIDHALSEARLPSPAAVGHRIVHGGPRLLHHCLIDQTVIDELELAEPFAPLHVPAALALLRIAMTRYPDAAQVACFDTAFHAGLPAIARTLPIPERFRSEGVHRYGFHGLSCESIMDQLGADAPGRVAIAHLGSGASVTAVRDGCSIDTSMGLTPSGGVVMGTRCGDIDPGVVLHLMRVHGCTAAELEAILDKEAGMLGISGLSGDMRRLHLAAPDPDAELAVRIFCRSVAKEIARMMTSLGGADLLVFTGGIGENDEAIRRAICADLAWAGVDSGTGATGASRACRTIALPTCEEARIAVHASDVLARRVSPERSERRGLGTSR